MDARISIPFIKANDVYEHVGDLAIEGDVGENANITIHNGDLTVTGNIMEGAAITMICALQTQESQFLSSLQTRQIPPSQFAEFTALAGNKGSFKAKTISSGMSLKMNERQILLGGVNINDRIITNDMVTELDDDRYLITPVGDNPFSGIPGPGNASATIDNKFYEGQKIIVAANMNVTVDGRPGIPKDTMQPEQNKLPARKTPPTLHIHKNVSHNVRITAEAEIRVEGSIGNYCKITSKNASIHAGNIGEYCEIKAQQAIDVQNIASSSSLLSTHSTFSAQQVANHASIEAEGDVTLVAMQSRSYAKSKKGCISISSVIEDYVRLHARNEISVGIVKDCCQLGSDSGSVLLRGDAGNDLDIKAYQDIKAVNIGANAKLAAKRGDIKLITIGKKPEFRAGGTITFESARPPALMQQGLFAAIPAEEDTEEAPEEYLCPITCAIMVHPFLCLLDSITYEYEAIKESLEKYHRSPMTNKEMIKGQTIDSILVRNINIESAIDRYTKSLKAKREKSEQLLSLNDRK
jgi:hypothetical protein